VTVEGQLEPGRLAVRVLDNGPGIPDADRSRIFQPFFTTRSRGSGLGLSIVQKIALLHNARVSVGASPAGGACFELSLPAAARA
jgi:signal transduction histidine kinase